MSEIYGNENLNSAPIKYEDLQHMDYLSRVIKETMRLFPLVACVTRHLKEDLKIGLLINLDNFLLENKIIYMYGIYTYIYGIYTRVCIYIYIYK